MITKLKTSYALYAYLYKPLMATINNDNFKVLYFSLEMNRMSLFVKLLSIYIFETFGIQLSFKKILFNPVYLLILSNCLIVLPLCFK